MASISIIMPVRDGIAYLAPAVESILSQTFRDFEFIVIDDHSSDRTRDFLEALDDSRVIVTSPDGHRHLTHALNHGCQLATSRYIARMDADDIAHPMRLERQFQFLEDHAEVGILGTQVRLIDQSSTLLEQTALQRPLHHEAIALELLFGCPLWHPTVMMRRQVLDELGWYGSPAISGRERYSGEDYDLWCRAIGETKMANLPDVLLDYRVHGSNLSLAASGRTEHCRNTVLVLQHFLQKHLGVDEAETVACCLLGYSLDGHPLPLGFSGSQALRNALPLSLEYARRLEVSPQELGAYEQRLCQILVRTLFAQGTGLCRNLLRVWLQSPRIAAMATTASLRRLL